MKKVMRVELLSDIYTTDKIEYVVGKRGVEEIATGGDFIVITYKQGDFEVNINKKNLISYVVERAKV